MAFPAPVGGRGGVKSVGHNVSDPLRNWDSTPSPLTPTVRHSKIELITQFLEVEKTWSHVKKNPSDSIPKLFRSVASSRKKTFGSETKFGLLIEHAIRAYHAHQVQPVEASSLLSATEQALIDRIEKRVEDMGTQTVERIANLTAKSSFETTYSSIIMEQIYDFIFSKNEPKQRREQIRSAAAQRMRKRFDKEGAEKVSSLIQENKKLETELAETKNVLNMLTQEFEDLDSRHDSIKADLEKQKNETQRITRTALQYQNENAQLHQQLNKQKTEMNELQKKLTHLLENHSRIHNNKKLLEMYEEERR
nr:hypothetical protein [Bacillus subtilis]MDH3148801.1 hypothetical protein [Bacillus subtilis]